MRSTQKVKGSGDDKRGKDKGSRMPGGGTSRKRKNTQDDVDVDDGNDDEEGMWQGSPFCMGCCFLGPLGLVCVLINVLWLYHLGLPEVAFFAQPCTVYQYKAFLLFILLSTVVSRVNVPCDRLCMCFCRGTARGKGPKRPRHRESVSESAVVSVVGSPVNDSADAEYAQVGADECPEVWVG